MPTRTPQTQRRIAIGPSRVRGAALLPLLIFVGTRLGGTDFEVVALSIDRDGQAVVKRFFDEIKVHALAIYVDTSAQATTKLGVIGVPTTLLIDPQGREIGRVTGPAEWDAPEVIDTIRRYLPQASHKSESQGNDPHTNSH